MSALMNPQPFPVPTSPALSRYSPSRFGELSPGYSATAGSLTTAPAGSRKRKMSDDEYDGRASSEERDGDHPMGSSERSFKAPKRMRSAVQGRPLPLSRKLETMDPAELQTIIKILSDRHPELQDEMSALCPNPSSSTALSKLQEYERNYRETFPFGGNPAGEYAYNRVRPALMQMLDALSDFTTGFLPPTETQASVSLGFLDQATEFIHRLPNWDNPLHNTSKQTAYEEMTKAWILVIQEAAKRGAGIQLHHGGWNIKLAKHDEQSGGRMAAAVNQMRQLAGWAGEAHGSRAPRQAGFGFGFGMHSGVGVPVRGM